MRSSISAMSKTNKTEIKDMKVALEMSQNRIKSANLGINNNQNGASMPNLNSQKALNDVSVDISM